MTLDERDLADIGFTIPRNESVRDRQRHLERAGGRLVLDHADDAGFHSVRAVRRSDVEIGRRYIAGHADRVARAIGAT